MKICSKFANRDFYYFHVGRHGLWYSAAAFSVINKERLECFVRKILFACALIHGVLGFRSSRRAQIVKKDPRTGEKTSYVTFQGKINKVTIMTDDSFQQVLGVVYP